MGRNNSPVRTGRTSHVMSRMDNSPARTRRASHVMRRMTWHRVVQGCPAAWTSSSVFPWPEDLELVVPLYFGVCSPVNVDTQAIAAPATSRSRCRWHRASQQRSPNTHRHGCRPMRPLPFLPAHTTRLGTSPLSCKSRNP